MHLILLCSMFKNVLAVTASKYPKAYAPPPIISEWSRIFLANQNVPKIPIKTTDIPELDWKPDISKCISSKDWAMSFDDGPSVFTTNVTLELLSVNGKATFFVIGSQVLLYQKQLIALHEQGHQIGIHTWSHTELAFQSNEQIVSEVLWTAKLIKDIIGVTPRFVRSPRGMIDERARAVVNAMGFVHAVWNVDSSDWHMSNYKPGQAGPNPSDIVQEFAKWIRESKIGRISLQHDAFRYSASVIGQTIKMVKAANYSLRTIAECTNQDPYDETIWFKVQDTVLPVFEASTTVPIPTSVFTIQPVSAIPTQAKVSYALSFSRSFMFLLAFL